MGEGRNCCFRRVLLLRLACLHSGSTQVARTELSMRNKPNGLVCPTPSHSTSLGETFSPAMPLAMPREHRAVVIHHYLSRVILLF